MSKILSSIVAENIRQFLEPLQVGVGSRGGCETVAHVVRQWLDRSSSDPRHVLAMLDLSNAFNCVDMSVIRSAVRTVVPCLAPWVDFCYGCPSNLMLGNEPVESVRGVQQGDPLGPALFAIAIQDEIRKAKAEVEAKFPGEMDFAVFYLDDGVLGGSSRAVKDFCLFLEKGFGEVGLNMQRDKCEIVPAARAGHLVDTELFNGFNFNSTGDFKLLGAPFGSAVFCAAHTEKRRAQAEELLKKVSAMQDAQSALHLIRQCVSFSKLVYSA